MNENDENDGEITSLETLEQSQNAQAPLTLVGKLAQIMAAVGRIAKTGENTFFKYRYVTEADLVAAVRPELAARGVMIIPTIAKTARTETVNQKGNKSYITDVEVVWTITDGNPQTIQMMIPGCAEDTGDKGIYKAITGSEKYMLKNLFLIPTGDDPESDSGSDHHPSAWQSAPLPQPPASRGHYPQKEKEGLGARVKGAISEQSEFPGGRTDPEESNATGTLTNVRSTQDGKAWFIDVAGHKGIWTRDEELAKELVKNQGALVNVFLRSKKPGSYQLIDFTLAEEKAS